MPKPRVLVVDDAAVMRRLVSEVLERDGRFELAGTAPNGRVALDRIARLNPDIVTLDLEMPEMDGLQTLRELRKTNPRLPVIMFSLLTRRGAIATLDALAAGASDYVTKPADCASLDESLARLASELLPKLAAHCLPIRPEGVTSATPFSPPPAPTPRLSRPSHTIELVCLATSTGGPNALATVFASFTEALPVPVAIVQHMPPMFTQMLAGRLDAARHKLRCHEATDGQEMRPGEAYLAPGGRHLAVERKAAGSFVARLTDAPPENSCRPAADVLLRSAAVAAGGTTLAVVMTGMGQDGMRGCELIREGGGQIIAQNEATSVVWGMPGAVVQAGLADAVLPLNDLAAEIARRVRSGRNPE